MVQNGGRNERDRSDMIDECEVRSLNIEAYCMLREIHPCVHADIFHIQQAKPSLLYQLQPLSVRACVVAVCISIDCNNTDWGLVKDCPLVLLILC